MEVSDPAGARARPDPISVTQASEREAAVIWLQLSRGDWSIVDRFDDGQGRRYVFALYRGPALPRPWHRLTARERSIVAEVARGRSNRQVAARLGVSASTVAGHLRAACRKLGGARRVDLVREWNAAHPSAESGDP